MSITQQEIEPGEQRRREVDVLHDAEPRLVAGPDRVRTREDRCPRVERGHDPGLGNRDSLLLHHLVQDRARRVVHLVKLVNAADPAVREDQGAGLEDKLFRVGVFRHVAA
jgi:hypothetical protein